jgi:hypothetical protein
MRESSQVCVVQYWLRTGGDGRKVRKPGIGQVPAADSVGPPQSLHAVLRHWLELRRRPGLQGTGAIERHCLRACLAGNSRAPAQGKKALSSVMFWALRFMACSTIPYLITKILTDPLSKYEY